MTQQWCVKAWAGSYSWTVKDDDPPAYGPAGPLTITSGLPNSDVSPLVQPDASTASFRVIVATVADLDQLQLGDPVTLRYFGARSPAAGDHPLVEFAGRVANLDAEPHDLGMLFTVTCVDYTADPGELTVGTVAYPQESLDARVRRILAEAGLNVPAGVGLYGGTATLPIAASIAARPIGPVSALELLTHTLAQFRMEFTGFPLSVGLAQLWPMTTPQLGLASTFSSGPFVLDNTLGPYLIQTVFQSPAYTAPLRLQLLTGTYQLTASTATSAVGGVAVTDAGRVDMSTKFTQRKGDATNAVQVNSDSFTPQIARWTGVAQPVWASVDTELVSAADGAALAALYLPPAQPSGKALWLADQLRWLIDQEPGAWGLPFIGRGFMAVRVKGAWSPLEREWYVGLIASSSFTLDGGVPSATLTMMPWNVDVKASLNPVKWTDLPAPMTYTNTSTRDTFVDYGLAGI